jgi:RNA polymerase sigma-70 factor (ECF subfamily)
MDLLQELFLEVIRDLGSFEVRSEASFLRWASVIARNNIRDRLRRRRESSLESFPELNPEERESHLDPSPSTVVSRQEEAEDLRRALKRLPGDYRDVIRLRDFDGLPYRQIARLLGRPSENAVQMLHHRALARLLKEMG